MLSNFSLANPCEQPRATLNAFSLAQVHAQTYVNCNCHCEDLLELLHTVTHTITLLADK